jgi:nucleoside-diphosphate-sugar epimerase
MNANRRCASADAQVLYGTAYDESLGTAPAPRPGWTRWPTTAFQDVVDAHRMALQRAPDIGFHRFIISPASPFAPSDLGLLRGHASAELRSLVPGFEAVFRARGGRMLEDIDRVCVNARARSVLGWRPQYDFERALGDLARGRDPRSPLTHAIASKGYHPDGAIGGACADTTG